MQDDSITIALGLPEVAVVWQAEGEEAITVEVRYRAQSAPCPQCGRRTPKVHSVRWQRKGDRGLRDKPVFLVLHKRRFRCLSCGKAFTEPDPVFGPRRRSSQRLQAVQQLGPAPFRRLLPMLRQWRKEILNYFDHPYTNGFVEGKNNRIKVIKRILLSNLQEVPSKAA